MTHSNIRFIGLDVHKDSIEIAIAEDGIGGEVRRFGAMGGTREAFKRALRKLVSQGGTLHFCYMLFCLRPHKNFKVPNEIEIPHRRKAQAFFRVLKTIRFDHQ